LENKAGQLNACVGICKKKVAVNTAGFWQNCVRQVGGSDKYVAEDTSHLVGVTVLLFA
jgi:hypothetical protein